MQQPGLLLATTTLTFLVGTWTACRADHDKPSNTALSADLRFEPEWRQKGDCGRCSLYILMRLEGFNTSIKQLSELVPTDPELGCSLAHLVRAAEQLGFPVEIRFVPPKEMPALAPPYVLHWNGSLQSGVGHFAVVTGYSQPRNEFQIIDAENDRCVPLPQSEIARKLSGYVLIPVRRGMMQPQVIASFTLVFAGMLIWLWPRPKLVPPQS